MSVLNRKLARDVRQVGLMLLAVTAIMPVGVTAAVRQNRLKAVLRTLAGLCTPFSS